MSREPFINRQYAYLKIMGSGPSDDITKVLEIRPDEEWSEGDEWRDNPVSVKRFFTLWRLNSGLDETEDLNRHIEELLRRIRRKREVILSLNTKYKAQVVCVSHSIQAFSFELDFELQKNLTDFGLGFWFDAYPYEDPHEIISNLRNQLTARGKK